MAVEVITWVFAHSHSRNGARLVMLAVADACNKRDGTGAWLSTAALCAKTGLSERAVRDGVKECEKLGELEVERGRGPGGVGRFRVLMTTSRKAADSAGLDEGRQNLPAGQSATSPSDDQAQVKQPRPADSAGLGRKRSAAESAPGTVSDSPSRGSTSKKRRRSPPKAEPYREDVERICAHLADKVEANGSKRPTITNDWRREARLLLDEKRPIPVTVDRVINAIDWATADHFWHRNVLSMPTLRKQWERLRLSKKAELEGRPQRNGQASNSPRPIPPAERCPHHPSYHRDRCGPCRSERGATSTNQTPRRPE